MRDIDRKLAQIEQHIINNTYDVVETDRFELKDLSQGSEWKELYKTICAFLNTKGGIIVVGIKEDTKNKKFKFTGFQHNSSTEDKIKDISKKFKNDDGKEIDLSEFIRPELIEIQPFMSGKVCLIFVEKLPEDRKFVFFENEAYERKITGDHKISKDKIKLQIELREELRRAIELEKVPDTSIENLDVDRLNEFILLLNNDKKVESIKADIESARSFLTRKKMVRDNQPTLLGLLVCGQNLFDIVGGKCEFDAYFESGNSLANDQKVYKDNVIPLMESAWNFTVSKIATGVSVAKGGTPLYEYPQEIIRETINNALAHRDYKSDRFSILRVKNNEYIEIRNPGKFRREQLFYSDEPIKIRRIIPIPKAQNPNLADILKIYKRWEGRGIGMASLTNFALDNLIDVPYYRLYNDNEIGLYIPKGKVLDESTVLWLNSFEKYILNKTGGIELTDEQKTVLGYFYKSELLNELERFTINLTPDNNHFEVIKDLLKYKLIYKLPQSTLELSVYQVEPILMKDNFNQELIGIYGDSYKLLSNSYKEVLQAIYQHNEYGKEKDISANLIGNYLYYKKNKSLIIDIKDLGNFKRKVRNEINKLEKEGFIIRKSSNKADYKINKEFRNNPTPLG